MKFQFTPIVVLCTVVLLSARAEAAGEKPRTESARATEVIHELTPAGKQLEARYASRQQSLQKEILAALPKISDAQKTALLEAFKTEDETAKRLEEQRNHVWRANKPVERLKELREISRHFDYTMEMDQAALDRAEALPDNDPDKAKHVESKRRQLEGNKAKMEKALRDLEKHEKGAEAQFVKVAEAEKACEAAAVKHEKAKAATRQALAALPLDGVLSGELDAQLAAYMVITEASPGYLAGHAQQGPEQQAGVEDFLTNTALMVDMLVADGAFWGKYGRAFEIYQAIQKASDKARAGVLRQLALAVAIHHAVPMVQDNPDDVASPEFIDPVKRYLHYENAYLNGELDPSFEDQCAWSLRMVVDDIAADECLEWGRRMFHAYRPDLLKATLDEGRYVNLIDKEISYTSKRVENDRADRHSSQNILNNGGICGRRAGLGRFLLKAFGVPCTNRPQKGHAALVHYAPGGWIPQLGGGWGAGSRTIFMRYKTDLDFQDSTQARRSRESYPKVKRAQWIALAAGEKPVYGLSRKAAAGFWNSIALIEQQRLVDAFEATAERTSSEIQVVKIEEIPAASRTIDVHSTGVITIPAVAVTYPGQSTKQSTGKEPREAITFMESGDGGWQLHFSKNAGWGPSFRYEFDAPMAGNYQMRAKVVTPGETHPLNVWVNDRAPIEMPIPDTVGLSQISEPTPIELAKGANTLTITGPFRGVIEEFILTPGE